MDDVARTATGGVDRAGNQIGPGVDVLLRVADDGRLAGRAAGGVDANHLFARYRKHAVGVVVTQILLGGEGKAGEVGQRLEIIRVHPGSIEAGPVMGHVGLDLLQRRFEALGLQGGDFIAAGVFDGMQAIFHCCLPVVVSLENQ